MKGKERLVFNICFAGVLLASLGIFWLHWDVYELQGDDLFLMQVSRRIAAGETAQILAPQHVHWQPLFRLIRLYFDLHFPDKYPGLHAVVVAAHGFSVWLLFLLCRRYWSSPWAALAAAAAFGCSTAGIGAVVWKAASHFVLAWPFVLGAVYCLTRLQGRRAGWWLAGSFLCQLVALGIFTGAVAVVPGIALAYFLLERPHAKHPGQDSAAGGWRDFLVVASGGGTIVIGLAAWLLFVLPAIDTRHYFGGLSSSQGRLAVISEGVLNTIHAYWIQAARALGTTHEPSVLWFAIPAAVLITAGWRRLNLRWIAVAMVLTALPLLLIFGVRRTFEVEYLSRYAYQTFTFWAVIAGSAVEALLLLAEDRPALRTALLAVLLAGGGVFGWENLRASAHLREVSRRDEGRRREFWQGWAAFFGDAAARSLHAGVTLTVPPMSVPVFNLWGHHSLHSNHYDIRAIFEMSYPGGKSGIALSNGIPPEEDQFHFWREVGKSRVHLAAFRAVSLPQTPFALDAQMTEQFQATAVLRVTPAPDGTQIARLPPAADAEWMLLCLEGKEPPAEALQLRLGSHLLPGWEYTLSLQDPGGWRRHWIVPSIIPGWNPAVGQELHVAPVGGKYEAPRVTLLELGVLR
ncbi:MAG: hypothetical protein HY236_07590 [Acidobacteria bacterium]|nr:hypothetical protein [Acidobacteriota bacterium]